jgi:hypothetical protein
VPADPASLAAPTVGHALSLLGSVSAVPLAHLFPAFADLAFADLLVLAEAHLRVDAGAVARQAAAAIVASDPARRLPRAAIADDTALVAQVGLLGALRSRSAALAAVSYQPYSVALPVLPAVPDGGLLRPPVLLPPALDAATFANRYAALVAGAPVVRVANDAFVPNGLLGGCAPVYKSDIAPPLALELLAANEVKRGRLVVIPLAQARVAAVRDGLALHFSPSFIARKTNDPLGRHVIDYSHGGPNSDAKADFLERRHGRLRLPQLGDFCTMLTNVKLRFPGVLIVGFKTDFDAWFKRILLCPADAPLLAYALALDGDGTGPSHAAIPLTEQFGQQEATYDSACGSALINQLVAARSLRDHGVVSTMCYVDDTIGFLPARLVAPTLAYITEVATAVAGAGAINSKKDVVGPVVDVIGWWIDVPNGTLSITHVMFLKLLALFFHETGACVKTGDVIAVLSLQRLSSYAIRTATVVPALRSFTRAFAINLAGPGALRDAAGVLCRPATANVVVDLAMWRSVLSDSVADCRRWVSSVEGPALLAWRVGEDRSAAGAAARAARLLAAADITLDTDACTEDCGLGARGVGFVFTDRRAWASTFAPAAGVYASDAVADFATHVGVDDAVGVPVSINTLEFAASVCGVAAACAHVMQVRAFHSRAPGDGFSLHGRVRQAHIHLQTDNTSARSWVHKHRAQYPVHLFLIHVLSLVLLRADVLLTSSHLPGTANVRADAASRNFQLPEHRAVREEMIREGFTRVPFCSTDFKSALGLMSTQAFSDISLILPAARTAAAGLLGLCSL